MYFVMVTQDGLGFVYIRQGSVLGRRCGRIRKVELFGGGHWAAGLGF